MILCRKELAKQIDSSVFPGVAGRAAHEQHRSGGDHLSQGRGEQLQRTRAQSPTMRGRWAMGSNTNEPRNKKKKKKMEKSNKTTSLKKKNRTTPHRPHPAGPHQRCHGQVPASGAGHGRGLSHPGMHRNGHQDRPRQPAESEALNSPLRENQTRMPAMDLRILRLGWEREKESATAGIFSCQGASRVDFL